MDPFRVRPGGTAFRGWRGALPTAIDGVPFGDRPVTSPEELQHFFRRLWNLAALGCLEDGSGLVMAPKPRRIRSGGVEEQ